jgi:hypothetical protein
MAIQRNGSVSSVREVGGEIEEEPNTTVVDEAIYVAVSKDVKESKLNLIWAIQNSGGKKICILFVHVPATMMPLSEFVAYMFCILCLCILCFSKFYSI